MGDVQEGPSDAAIRTAAAGLMLIVGAEGTEGLPDDLDALTEDGDVPATDIMSAMGYVAHRLALAMGPEEATPVLRQILFDHLE